MWPKPVLTLQAKSTILDDEGFDTKDEATYTLQDVFEKREHVGADGKKLVLPDGQQIQLQYEYDMGDGWIHDITLLGRADQGLHHALTDIPPGKDAIKVLCLSGEGHPCAEDAGSGGGWEDLKAVFKKGAKADKEGRRDWYKHYCANGDPKGLDPWRWDLLEVNDALQKVEV